MLGTLMNQTFMRCNFDFGLPVVIFTCHPRETAALKVRDAVKNNTPPGDTSAETLVSMCRALEAIVAHYHPELAGGSVVMIEHCCLLWEIYYYHPNLPRQMTQDISIMRVPLVPDPHPADRGMPPVSLEKVTGLPVPEGNKKTMQEVIDQHQADLNKSVLQSGDVIVNKDLVKKAIEGPPIFDIKTLPLPIRGASIQNADAPSTVVMNPED